ncbi:RNase adapter RapZ [Roseicyclus sp. F158]|uniref:RNase adapter RapZ n=1 Tax=Tropicimonas omnivorans TaxID=3075590 RepID=A0ABU3DD63_9RHOB|nr:RNase adapter RapZ [Roseicyclus sp. F158]MDT0681652.1 RNase adapter RapZ [Roseicyclus sp. F158]
MNDPRPDAVRSCPEVPRFLIVTGVSGAGRTVALRAMEDIGFEPIDNLPLSLLGTLSGSTAEDRRVVVGVGTRNRDFSPEALLAARGPDTVLVYLDSRTDILVRRYSETRRRHPIGAETAEAGVLREMELLAPVRDGADMVIDTSEMTQHDLRAEMERRFRSGPAQTRLSVSVESFSYRQGIPGGLDFAFDCRFLDNPHWVEELRPLDGRSPEVAAHVASDPRHGPYLEQVLGLLTLVLPAQAEEGRAHVGIGFGCTGGQHRSVAMVERVSKALAAGGWQVSTRHREIERRAGGQGRALTGTTA